MTLIPSISSEYVELPFVDNAGTVTAGSVELALMPPGLVPADADWHPAEWDGVVATLLVGGTGGVDIAAGTVYVLWLRFEAGAQRPARATGYVMVLDEVPA